jgi:hypothetical protein
MKPKEELIDTPLSVSRIPCTCGREYIGETRRLLGVRIMEHKYNIRLGYFDGSKFSARGFEEGYQID